jgi:uncharacterized protein (TIGR03437 family)
LLAKIQGANLAAETLTATPPELPTTLGGVSVTDVEGRAFPLSAVSPSEITVLLAPELFGEGQGEVWLQVKRGNGEDSDWVRVELAPAPSGATTGSGARWKHKPLRSK